MWQVYTDIASYWRISAQRIWRSLFTTLVNSGDMLLKKLSVKHTIVQEAGKAENWDTYCGMVGYENFISLSWSTIIHSWALGTKMSGKSFAKRTDLSVFEDLIS